MIDTNIDGFFKNYSEEEKAYVKSVLLDAEEKTKDQSSLDFANILSDKKYNKYPEIQYFRIKALMNVYKYNKAYNIALNNQKFFPIKNLVNLLGGMITSLEPRRISTQEDIVNNFLSICSEVDKEIVHKEIENLNFDDTMELNFHINKMLEISDINKQLDYLKKPGLDSYTLLLYIRIKNLFKNGNYAKASKMLRIHEDKDLFKLLKNSYRPEVKEEIIEEDKEEVKEVFYEKNVLSILLTKLYVDNITKEEIDEAVISDFLKVIFKIAYYEKYNRKYGEKYLKENIKKYKLEEKIDKVKTLNRILAHYNNKHGISFDMGFYQEIIGGELLLSELDSYRSSESVKVLTK